MLVHCREWITTVGKNYHDTIAVRLSGKKEKLKILFQIKARIGRNVTGVF
jgi:hypothetical protein